MAKRSKNDLTLQVLGGIICIVAMIIFGELYQVNQENMNAEYLQNVDNVEENNEVSNSVNGKIIIDFIDVGQGDSILIRQGDSTMIIDGGTSSCKDDLLNFLKSENIDKFEYVIGTHVHEDHIGSLDDVINAYYFDTIIFPKATATTKTFENFVNAVKNKDKKFTNPVPGTIYEFGEATFEILAPNSESYSSANDYSIVIKLTFGNNTFIFTGDCELESEAEMIAKGFNLKADVLKIAHHGSTTSTSKAFLDAVSPSYAVICVGNGNTYNHPTKTTMSKLQKMNIAVYRTDEQGTVQCVSDGNTITFNVEPGSYNYGSQ